MKDLANVYLSLKKLDWKILGSIFKNMWDFEYVPSHAIIRETNLSEEELEAKLKRLASMRLVENKYTEYLGTAFTFKGLSVYSLKRLVTAGKVEQLGSLIGEGKESVVYTVISQGKEAVLKFHRVGYPSFKKVKEKRDYGTLHYTVLTVRSARREFQTLKKLYKRVSVPRPIAWEGNAVLMELIDAKELYKVRLENPKDVLEMILEEVKKMYELGVVHGDLSQFNILVNEEGIYFIDFPQSMEVGEDGSEEILKRDVENILKYFKKAYGIERDLKQTLEEIKKG